MKDDAGALSGVRVLDFTQYYAGPVATHHLGMLGADVVKVEPLHGETMRYDGSDRWADAGLAPGWAAFNLNKRSLALDVRTPEGLQIAHRLTEDADILCENFRPGVMTRLGLDYATAGELNPRLIYCSVSGFGSTGPEGSTPAFDGKIQAMSGLMAVSGDADSGPMRTGVAIADIITGITTAFALTAALNHRAATGEGQYVDVSMFESVLSALSDQVAGYTMRDEVRIGGGNLSVTGKPTADRFATSDGYVVLAALTDAQYDSLLGVLGLTHLQHDDRFATWPDRMRNREPLREALQEVILQRTTDEWTQALDAANVPFGPVLDVGAAVSRPQIAHRGFLHSVDTPLGKARVAGEGFTLQHGTRTPIRFAPALGQHTSDILTSIGYDDDAIADLRARTVVR